MNAVEFPAWTRQRGSAAAAGRARQLGSQWQRGGCRDELPTSAVAADELVFVSQAADLDPRLPGPRLYLAAELLGGALAAAPTPAQEQHVRERLAATGWGTLTLLTGSRAPARVAGTVTLVDGLLEHWAELSRLRFVATLTTPVDLAEVVLIHLGGLLAMWLDRPGPDLPGDLRTARDALLAADPPLRDERIVARLAELAAATPRITHRRELTDPARLAGLVAGLTADEEESLAAGDTAAALTLLYGTDRYL